MGMKKDTVVDRKTLKKNNSVTNNIAMELYEEQQYFPDEPLEALKLCGWNIIGVQTQASTSKMHEGECYHINLIVSNIRDRDELVECLLHELAHVHLKHCDKVSTYTVMSKQEKDAEALTTKWFNQYYFNKNNPIKS